MFSSMITTVADRFDSQFLAAYWLPAFVATLGGLGIVVARVGPDQAGAWINDRDSAQQTLVVVIGIVVITMFAFVLRALRLPIADLFSGAAFPRVFADRSTQAQQNARHAAFDDAARERFYPRDDANTQPTRFGNVLAAAAEHPRVVYAMDGALWWPRLSPLLPSAFQQLLGAAQAPTMALLNLSAILTALGIVGAVVLAVEGALWPGGVIVLVAGLVLSRLAYLAAVSQASEFARLIRVAFDLYRQEILSQMGLTLPVNLSAERALWRRLTDEIIAAPSVAGEGAAKPLRPANDLPVDVSQPEAIPEAG